MQTAAEHWAFTFLNNDPRSDDGAVQHALGLSKLYRDEPTSNTGTLMMISAFIGHAWGHWPEQMYEWTTDYLAGLDDGDRPDRKRREVLYMALGFCPDEMGRKMLDTLTPIDADDAKDISAGIRLWTADLTTFEPGEGSHLDMLWGAFFGSGRSEYLRQVLVCLPWMLEETSVRKSGIGKAAYDSFMSFSKIGNLGFERALHEAHVADPGLEVTLTEIAEMFETQLRNLHTM